MEGLWVFCLSCHSSCLLCLDIFTPKGFHPGAVGRRRFKLPLTMARITGREGRLIPEILAVE